MVRNLALERADRNIRISSVAPAVVKTPVYNGFMSGEERALILPAFNGFRDSGRDGQPADIAQSFLENANWMARIVLPVGGGVKACRTRDREGPVTRGRPNAR